MNILRTARQSRRVSAARCSAHPKNPAPAAIANRARAIGAAACLALAAEEVAARQLDDYFDLFSRGYMDSCRRRPQ